MGQEKRFHLSEVDPCSHSEWTLLRKKGLASLVVEERSPRNRDKRTEEEQGHQHCYCQGEGGMIRNYH